MSNVKIVGALDPALIALLQGAGYSLEVHDLPDEVRADDLEGLTPILLAEAGRYTASGIESGLRRDFQATRRFIRLEESQAPAPDREEDRQLKILRDFTVTVATGRNRQELFDSAIRFLQYAVGCDAVVLHEDRPEGGLVLLRQIGLDSVQVERWTALLEELAHRESGRLLAGFQYTGREGVGENPAALSAMVPLLYGKSRSGVLGIRLVPDVSLSLECLLALGRILALAISNCDLREESSQAIESLRQAQKSMSQAEKLAAVGMLAAGVAHEINNPAAFIITNLTVLEEYVQGFVAYQRALDARLQAAPDGVEMGLKALREQHELDYLLQDAPELIARCLTGMRRIHEIVKDLRSFAHKGTGQAEWVDINQFISQVLKLAGAELRHRAGLELDLRPLPRVHLESTQLVQVLLNLVINAYQSFGDRPRPKNMIWVASRLEGGCIHIDVTDNGCGIPEEVRGRLFEPFFTTKPVGAGTGLGLAISWELVRNMHGRITVDSTEGRGSRFTVELTLQQEEGGAGLPWRPAEGTA
ncbi:MAG: hypothetical protein JW797_07990 [Bradymonadales bacterium]|nr:hypothetical protein [Bradymonadales bacterium]